MLKTQKSWCKQACTVANKGINFCSVYGGTNEDQERDMYIYIGLPTMRKLNTHTNKIADGQ